MTGPSIVIFVCIVGGIALLAIVSSYLDAASGSWKALAERYPEQPHDIGAPEGTIRIFVFTEAQWARAQKPVGCLWLLIWPVWFYLWFRRYGAGRYNVSYITDSTHLHLDLASGLTGARRRISVPLYDMRMIARGPTHIGAFAWFGVDTFVMGLPEVIIEDELAMRAEFGEPGVGP